MRNTSRFSTSCAHLLFVPVVDINHHGGPALVGITQVLWITPLGKRVHDVPLKWGTALAGYTHLRTRSLGVDKSAVPPRDIQPGSFHMTAHR